MNRGSPDSGRRGWGRLRSLDLILYAWLVAAIGLALPARAEHRATRLGNPATRFADPLRVPSDLRERLTSDRLKADVESILRQGKYSGDVGDFRRAAAVAEIEEWSIPIGGRMPYMSTRRNGQPIVLWDVVWEGKEPISAYAFEFDSKGRRYRCITPKACSNFWVEELVLPPPAISLVRRGPVQARRCDVVEQVLEVRNTGMVPLTEVILSEAMADGLQTRNPGALLNIAVGNLKPGEGQAFRYSLSAPHDGVYHSRAVVTSAQGARADAATTLNVKSAELRLECKAPSAAWAGRPLEFCLRVWNAGAAADEQVTVWAPLPEGATVVEASTAEVIEGREVRWKAGALGAGESRELCVKLVLGSPGAVAFRAEARGVCSAPVGSECVAQVSGIAAILLEVIDLEDPIEVGSNLTYEIRVVNQGTSPGTRIKLVCKLEAAQEFVSGEGPTEIEQHEGMVQIKPLASLAPKATATWKLVIKATKAADVRFAVELTSDQIDRPVTETEATQQY